MPYGTLYIDAEETGIDSDQLTVMDPARVQMEYEGDSDGIRECQHCHGTIEVRSFNEGTEDAPKWTEQYAHQETGDRACKPEDVSMHDPDFEPEVDELPNAEPIPRGCADIVNSASINFDDDHMECTVTISVGDPRGAFAMTIRRLNDGKLILHVPHEAEPLPHMPLHKLHEGTYEILGA
jgi:hypothetical protein